VIEEQLPKAQPEFRSLPWTGPKLIGVVKPTDATQQFETMMLGAQGTHLASLPAYWVGYEKLRADALRRSAPLGSLKLRDAQQRQTLEAALQAAKLNAQTTRWLPLVSSRASWVALLNERGDWVASAGIDSF
jgi:hypothetical protein